MAKTSKSLETESSVVVASGRVEGKWGVRAHPQAQGGEKVPEVMVVTAA